MSENLSLFGDDEAPTRTEGAAPPMPIADWLVQRLREALDSRGLTSMAQRRDAIESAAGRPVESLRALTHPEGLQVLSAIGHGSTGGGDNPSAWDDRDEDTWIDRL